mmetsp:Transcript_10469/g.42330  ORF Transcript_10469/g.42330 Transcript_10469/m.42330 type:complete len:338 (-) Transcript_10469:1049-2062(-)
MGNSVMATARTSRGAASRPSKSGAGLSPSSSLLFAPSPARQHTEKTDDASAGTTSAPNTAKSAASLVAARSSLDRVHAVLTSQRYVMRLSAKPKTASETMPATIAGMTPDIMRASMFVVRIAMTAPTTARPHNAQHATKHTTTFNATAVRETPVLSPRVGDRLQGVHDVWASSSPSTEAVVPWCCGPGDPPSVLAAHSRSARRSRFSQRTSRGSGAGSARHTSTMTPSGVVSFILAAAASSSGHRGTEHAARALVSESKTTKAAPTGAACAVRAYASTTSSRRRSANARASSAVRTSVIDEAASPACVVPAASSSCDAATPASISSSSWAATRSADR